jgi:glyoxylase-like metal-dependent hydrolase (beta-lactamase superfamily II)
MAAGVALMSTGALAQQAPNYAAVQIKATDLGNRTWMLEGQGGNMVLVAGDDANILVDTEFAPLHEKIAAAIAQLNDKPVKYVVNSHLHGDHTGGNQQFWLKGATLVSTKELASSLAAGTTNALTGAKTPPAPKAAVPQQTYSGSTTLSVKGRRVQLVHMPHAHTQGDTAIWVTDANVLATGDIVSIGNRYPNVDVGDGGDIDGIIGAVDAYIRRANDKTKVVPGHGPLMSKADLITYRKMLVDARAAVAKLKASGLTEEQAAAAKPLADDVQKRAGANDAASVNFVRLIYKSI